jgi:UPF0716 protein FxsA
MFGLVFLLLIVVPIVEFYVLVQVADGLGWLPSIVLLLAVSMIGASLMKWQAAGAIGRIQATMAQGKMPSKELADAALMIFGGALLLTPGFFTDVVGLAMFIPPLRAIARVLLLKRFRGKVSVAGRGGKRRDRARCGSSSKPYGSSHPCDESRASHRPWYQHLHGWHR